MGLMQTQPGADYVDAMAIERDRLLELLRSVGATDWSRATPCAGWDVADLCRHLLGDDLHSLSAVRDGYPGHAPPSGLDTAGFIGWLDELQANWVTAARRLSPALTVQLLQWTGPEVVEAFRRLDPITLGQVVSWAGDQPAPVWLHLARELSEYWIHRQQIRQALNLPADLRPDLTGPVLDALRWAYPYRLQPVPARVGDTVEITISGPVDRNWFLVRHTRDWEFENGCGPARVGALNMSTDQAWRLLTNNLPAAEQLNVVGLPDIVYALLNTRAIIGTPRRAAAP